MVVQIISIIIGLVLLVKGAEWMVKGASMLAKQHNFSDLAIGLTVVAFGTSAPELVVSIFASVQKHQDIVFGNVIGSNIFNLYLILGLTGLIAPLVVQSSTVWKEIPISLFAIIVLYFFSNVFFLSGMPVVSRLEGVALFSMLGMFLYYVFKQLKNYTTTSETEQKKFSSSKIFGLIIFGLAGLIIGGRFVVTNAVSFASAMGMSEKIIGLTIVATGTSLPELATSVVAVFKKKNDIAVGNIIGSNIFNILFILGVSSIIRPINYDLTFNTEIYLLIGGTIFLFMAMFTGQKGKLDRWEAGVLFVSYVVYMTYLINKEM